MSPADSDYVGHFNAYGVVDRLLIQKHLANNKDGFRDVR
jgi:hypothetical protein